MSNQHLQDKTGGQRQVIPQQYPSMNVNEFSQSVVKRRRTNSKGSFVNPKNDPQKNWRQKFGNNVTHIYGKLPNIGETASNIYEGAGNLYKGASNYVSTIHTPEFFPKNPLLPEKVDDLTIKMSPNDFSNMIDGIGLIGRQFLNKDIKNKVTSFKVHGCSLPEEDRQRCKGNYISFLIDFYNSGSENIYSLQMNGWRCGIVLKMKDRQVTIEKDENTQIGYIKIDNNNDIINLSEYIDNVPTNVPTNVPKDPEPFAKFMFNDVISKEYNKKYSIDILQLNEQINDIKLIKDTIGLNTLFNDKDNKIRIVGEITPPIVQLNMV